MIPPAPDASVTARPYHHLLRGPRFAGWRAALTFALAIAFAMLSATAVLGVAKALGADAAIDSVFEGNEIDPLGFAFGNIVLALLIPSALLATRVAHGRGAGRLSSVTGRIRWRWLLRCMAVLLPLFVVYLALDLVIDRPEDGMHPQWAMLSLVILASTPLQAAGEEYFARGLILQNVGSLFADPRLAAGMAAVPAVLVFAAAHGSPDPWIFTDLAIFGAACTLLALRTGGLEAPIALHAINNVVGMITTLLFGGWMEGFVDADSVGQPLDPLLTLLACAIAVPLLLRLASRDGIAVTATSSLPPKPRRLVSEVIAVLVTLAITLWLVQALVTLS